MSVICPKNKLLLKEVEIPHCGLSANIFTSEY